MSRARSASVLVALSLAGCQLAPGALSAPADGTFVAGRVLVQLKPGASPEAIQAVARVAGGTVGEPVAPGLWLIEVPPGSERAAMGRASARAEVSYVEVDGLLKTQMVGGFTPYGARRIADTTDPFYDPEAPETPGGPKRSGLPGQWGLKAMKVPDAWSRTTGARMIVAVLDTGADMGHEDLAANLDVADARNFNVTKDNGETATNPDDDYGHGTHVAGIIAAVANNGVGIKGVAPGCKVMPIRVLGVDGGSSSNLISGIDWAIAHHANVINMSLGSNQYNRAEEDAIDRALAAGIPVVAAAGNEALGGNPLSYPAALPGVISVAALKATFDTSWGITALDRGDFSNFNPFITVSAPGVDILSTVPRRFRSGATDAPYAYASGTSMASPMVAGVVALMLSQKSMTPAEVAARLRKTALDLGPSVSTPGLSGQDIFFGAGIVQAPTALQ